MARRSYAKADPRRERVNRTIYAPHDPTLEWKFIPVYYSNMKFSWSTCPEVERTPEKVSGNWVFRGTRVPVQALFQNLEDGGSVDDFIRWFPGVTKRQVDAVLEHASQSLAVESAS